MKVFVFLQLGNDLNKAFRGAVFKIIDLLQCNPTEKMVEILIKVLKVGKYLFSYTIKHVMKDEEEGKHPCKAGIELIFCTIFSFIQFSPN